MTYFVETARYNIVNVPSDQILFSVNGDFLRSGKHLIPIVGIRLTQQRDMDAMVSTVTNNGKFGCE